MRVNEELTVGDNEFRLRLIAFKLYTVSSKSLMQSVVFIKELHNNRKGRGEVGKGKSQSSLTAVVRTNIVAQRAGISQIANLRSHDGIHRDTPRGVSSSAAPQAQRPPRAGAHRSPSSPCSQIDDCANQDRSCAGDRTQHIEVPS